jgi:hypothetical protein
MMTNPWKLTAIGMALVMATALVTGLVVANWTGTEGNRTAVEQPTPAPSAAKPTPAKPRSTALPTQAAIDACNRQASAQVGPHDKTMEVVKDGAIGAAVGAAVGAAGGAIAGGGKGAGKGAAIGGIAGAGGGALYGLNENKKHDERYRDAYARCMRSRGYTS